MLALKWIVLAILIVLSFVARVMIRHRQESHVFVMAVTFADMFFLAYGIIVIMLADASMTNSLANYEPDLDRGGLPPEVAFGNLLIFFSPLVVLGLKSVVREMKNAFNQSQTVSS